MSLKSKRSRKQSVYRSGLEKRFAQTVPKRRYLYEPYTKGFFRTGDTQKYTSIRDSIKPTKLIFVLSDPNKKVRKGSKITMGQWCHKEGFEFYTVDEYVDHVTNNG
jgi:hypothetical protein